jgi:fumarylacetoacetate (FAA) hydrolase
MKLATYRDGSRDGQLVVVSRDGALAHYATGIADTLQQALDDWNFIAPQLHDLAVTLDHGKARHAFAFDPRQCAAPLPRAVGWWVPEPDGDEPLPWRSDALWGPVQPLPAVAGVADVAPTLAVIGGDVAAGVDASVALEGVRLLALACLWWHGSETPERPWGVSVAPCVVTPDELGSAWRDGRLALSVTTVCQERKLGIADGTDQPIPFGAVVGQRGRAGGGLAAGRVVVAGWGTAHPVHRGRSAPRGHAVMPRWRCAGLPRRAPWARSPHPWLTAGDRASRSTRGCPTGASPSVRSMWTWPAAG